MSTEEEGATPEEQRVIRELAREMYNAICCIVHDAGHPYGDLVISAAATVLAALIADAPEEVRKSIVAQIVAGLPETVERHTEQLAMMDRANVAERGHA